MVYGRFSQVVGRLPEFSLMRSHNGAKNAVIVITFHFQNVALFRNVLVSLSIHRLSKALKSKTLFQIGFSPIGYDFKYRHQSSVPCHYHIMKTMKLLETRVLTLSSGLWVWGSSQ